jgi:hypothetical protein
MSTGRGSMSSSPAAAMPIGIMIRAVAVLLMSWPNTIRAD